MATAEAPKCTAMCSDQWRSWNCERPAKGILTNGKPGCGIHIATEKRAATNRAKRAAVEADQHALRARLLPTIDALRRRGFRATDHGPMIRLSLTIDEAERLLIALGNDPA